MNNKPLPPMFAALLGPGLTAALVEFIVQVIEESNAEHDGRIAAAAFEKGLACVYGSAKARAAVRMFLGREIRSDAVVAVELGEKPAALSKRHKKLRQNLGISPALRFPKNARAGAKPKGGAAATIAND